eukprot:gene3562-2513_t
MYDALHMNFTSTHSKSNTQNMHKGISIACRKLSIRNKVHHLKYTHASLPKHTRTTNTKIQRAQSIVSITNKKWSSLPAHTPKSVKLRYTTNPQQNHSILLNPKFHLNGKTTRRTQTV